MKLVLVMVGGSTVSAFLITKLPGIQASIEVWYGMIGPLGAASAEWIATERRIQRRPDSLTSLRMWIFVVKVIFFGGYVTAVVSASLVRPFPFIVSFTSYFLALHIVEAIALHRLSLRTITHSGDRND